MRSRSIASSSAFLSLPLPLFIRLKSIYSTILTGASSGLLCLFPNLDKVVFLDDDIVVQRDLSPLWEIDLEGKVNGAVETCRGEDEWVMSKHFRNYFNFSHPLIANNLNPDECAWAYGMNVFDLHAWRNTNIRETYHSWLKENLKSNLTMWKLGTLPPALIAFRGHVHPIDPSWHMLGLGYQNKTNIENVKKAAVIHYNGQSKPWLQIGFDHLRPFWTKFLQLEFLLDMNLRRKIERKLVEKAKTFKPLWVDFAAIPTFLQIWYHTDMLLSDKFRW